MTRALSLALTLFADVQLLRAVWAVWSGGW